MPRKKTVPTEPQPDPPAEITEATVEPAPNPIEQQPPDILNGSTPPGEDLETPSVPSETDAETEVALTEASEDAEEPSYDDTDTENIITPPACHHEITAQPLWVVLCLFCVARYINISDFPTRLIRLKFDRCRIDIKNIGRQA